MSDGKDARREGREPESPRPSGDAREPESPPAPEPEGIRESGDTGGPGDTGESEDTGESRDTGGSRRARVSEPDGPHGSGPVPPEAPTWLRGLGKPHGQEPKQPKQSHAGNGTVNHGPDDQGPEGLEQAPEGLDSDELALRTMLHQAVREVEPSDGTLDYLRRAVPARRARKRQALVGMAAAVLFLGTAVPAAVHVSGSTGSDANPSAIGHASEAQGGTGEGKGPGGGETTAGGTSDQVGGADKDDEKGKDKDKDGASTGTGEGATEGADPSAGTAAGAPACTAAQLGPAAPSSAAPDSTGAVYGSFKVANVSSESCTVDGPGSVSATPAGAADAAKVTSARHMAGDAAAGLPDPSLEAMSLVLKPGEAYEVKFAWVPSEPCPTTGGGMSGGTGGPSPDPSPTENPTTASGATTGTETGMSPQLVMEDGTADGSVTVTYTAATGSGAGTVTVSNACAGTVYWTGLLPPAM
ncbi:hypothetical protein SUDANB176_03994 [Streptomyces sp. enrichment culture]|uniref:hypothetical protein n=1 Tax=Streptomyces sp. enrichment culture TaxID=1795815 RepID=UPI003F5557D0